MSEIISIQKKDLQLSVTERIMAFEQAVSELGDTHPLVFQYREIRVNCLDARDKCNIDLLAYLKLRIVTAALNEGWEPQFTKDELRSRSTRYPLAYYRGMIAEQLRKRGYTLPAIGIVLGRNHSSILHELYILRNLCLPGYSAIYEEYEAFRQKCMERRLDGMVRETLELINRQNEEIK